MVADSKRLGFPMLAGSSLPVTWRLPELELPLECEIEDALMVGVGSSDPMDYHALEAMQCMVERRHGGETGIKSVQLIEGDAVWKAGEEGRWSKALLSSALSRSDLLMGKTLEDARPQDLVGSGVLSHIVPQPAAYLIERRDGTAHHAPDAQRRRRRLHVRLPPQRTRRNPLDTVLPHANAERDLLGTPRREIEEMFATGKAPYPVERTLTACGILDSCLDSKVQNHEQLATPHLDVTYRATSRIAILSPVAHVGRGRPGGTLLCESVRFVEKA